MLSVTHTESNIAPIMAVLEVNSGHGLVRTGACDFDGRSQCGNRQYTTTSRHNFTIRTLRSGMKNFDAIKFRRCAEAGDGFAGVYLFG